MSDDLYTEDYARWAELMATTLEEKCFGDLDIDHLVTEIRDLSKRERDKLLSSLRLILHHLLKWDFQKSKRSRSWQVTIQWERNNLDFYLEDSPSLKKYLCQEWINKMYRNARLDAILQTGLDYPQDCPYTIIDIMEKSIDLEF
ncbi:DUF29 domain-containing protein [Candidatus Synechococcus calcipolaris G9]|uniref:DUF29 domain-containing protein n=1 Tax=Candidatus Synechococcus calcipolaris G9 TaxID=1497997 RepID=A0ABT6F0R9_9SYNE|nr:DUF29 domain-containing protein [Candidatus Synechococcus calcipolaris]MDG2991437.1 DUF29 domain-containing protein [Candidatus Synechococcus calcipolaris G9]